MNDNYARNTFICVLVLSLLLALMIGILVGQSIVHIHFVIDEHHLQNLMVLYDIKL